MLKNLLRRFDERLDLNPVLDTIKRSRPPDYLSPLDAPPISPGHIALLLVAALVLSGLAMTYFYNPTAEQAASSLARLRGGPLLGWMLHNIHRWSALLLIMFVILHALRVWLRRAYRYPRDLNWWLGLCLWLLVFALGGTGYLLRWDIKAFALMDLVVSSLSDVPMLGVLFVTVLLGGSEFDVVPLYRGYALHVWFLPLVLVLLIALHLLIVWRQGLLEIPAFWQYWREKIPLRRWFHLLPGLTLIIILLALSAATPNGDQSDPNARSGWPHPDWLLMFYFLPFWFFKGESRVIGTLVIPLGVLLFLAVAPRLERFGSQRIFIVTLATLCIAGVVWLFGQTSTMGYEVPLPGCNACHRPTIIGGAPSQLSEFDIRDPDWLVFHLKDPLGSLLVPFSAPSDAP